MTTPTLDLNTDNVIDLFTGRPLGAATNQRFIRLAPELDGLEMLYSNESSGEKLFSLKVLCWALRDDGNVVGLVPWLNDIVACTDIDDPLHGAFEGYYDPGIDEIFYEPPIHKVVEVETAAEYYETEHQSDNDIIQEIPDLIGTHAVLECEKPNSLALQEVVSWRLHADGSIFGMLVNEKKVVSTPILPGDECLYPSQLQDRFRYFFQHNIANKIKSRDPEALAAVSLLVDDNGVK